MTEREKVIKGLECCLSGPMQCKVCPYKTDADTSIPHCVRDLRENTITMLKAQEPVKPFVTGNGHTFEEAETWWYECGNCNEPIDPNDQYCRHCGRKVKWDDSD